MEYVGTRWYKCDLHLHTTASRCFEDQDVTAEEWVNRALEQGLDCVAITDHNTGAGIDEIKAIASTKGLIVFPGVEITCDPSKVHLLILFDVNKTSEDISDFLVRADIRRENFGEQETFTSKSIFDIAKLAHDDGAIIVPAHIDEYNGLGSISFSNLKKFFELSYVTAVQVVHNDFLNSDLNRNGYDALIPTLNNYYSNPSPPIDAATIKSWHDPVKLAMENEIAILTFSDNPHEPQNSKHGLNGIGSVYSWVKMDQGPSLEGLRQAFLLPQFRIRNCFQSVEMPYQPPSLWIKSISILNTSITEQSTPLVLNFSPQLNAIIGGRGSGKSSILRFIRGVFNKTLDLNTLDEIFKDHSDFYRHHNSRTEKGVITNDSEIKIEFVRDGIIHVISASNITSSEIQNLVVQRLASNGEMEAVESEGYIAFFEFEHYSQKQIYEIAQEPNSLRKQIDSSIPELESLVNEKEAISGAFLAKSSSIRSIELRVSKKGRLETEIEDLQQKISLLQESGIADLIESKEKYDTENEIIEGFIGEVESRENELNTLIEGFDIENIDLSQFDESHSEELTTLSERIIHLVNEAKSNLNSVSENLSAAKTEFNAELESTEWKVSKNTNQSAFEEKRVELESQGLDFINNFEILSEARSQKTRELSQIIEFENRLIAERHERTQLQTDFLNKCKQITQKRTEFLSHVLNDEKVEIKIKPFRDRRDFILRLRKILQREDGGYYEDIQHIANICFQGNVEQTINQVRQIFLKIRDNTAVEGVSGYLTNLVKNLNAAQVDEIELLLPEDEIEIKYRANDTLPFKSLTVASAGQKTTAILTFIMSFGNTPLILDQPEDDLDNRLVYDLIVDRLNKAKENRQIIVVTHNANIPVNGDAEYIISMDSESPKLKVIQTGTVEQPVIKKEICDVMEGSEYAFDMRSKRYKAILND